MANQWTVKAWELNETLSRFHCLPYIFYWNTAKGNLGNLRPGDKKYKLFLLSSLLTLTGSFWLLLAAIWKSSHYLGDDYPWACVWIWVFFSLGIFLAFTFDVVLIVHAHRFVDSLNNVMILLSELDRLEGIQIQQRRGKLSSNDILGLIGIGTVLITHSLPIVVPLSMLPVQPDLDPIHSIMEYYYTPNYLDQWPVPALILWWTVRVFIWVLLLSCPLRTISVLGLTVILETPIFYDCLRHCKADILDYPMLSRYDKFFRIRCINVKGCAAALASLLPVGFTIQVHEHIMCFYGFSVLNPSLYALLVALTVMGDSLNYIMLTLGANLFEDANGLIENWKQEVYKVRNPSKRRHIAKLLNHFRPVCFRCGDFAILQRDTKKDYYSAHQDWFIDVMFMVKPSFTK